MSEVAKKLADAGLTVKPLVWGADEDWKACSREFAPAFGGRYQVIILDPPDGAPHLYFDMGLGAFHFRLAQEPDPEWPGKTRPKQFASVDDVKAAAQADYERRIFSALEGNG